jgi:CDGSH-type Zn-finger protein
MSDKVFASKTPYAVEVKKGDILFWCQCGRSILQPFCDGSHKDTDFTLIIYTSDKDKAVYFCGCKKTKNPPLCDGSHKHLA